MALESGAETPLTRPLSPRSALFWPSLLVWILCTRHLYWLTVAPLIRAVVGPYESVAPAMSSRLGIDIGYLPLSVLFDILLVLAALKLSGLKEADIGWRRPPRRGVLWLAAVVALAFVEYAAISAWTGHARAIFHPTPSGPKEALATAVLFAYGAEELADRGVIYALLRLRIGRWPALALSAGVFACLHYTLGDFLTLFGIRGGDYGGYPLWAFWDKLLSGAIYCVLLDCSDWIAVPIVAHGLHNVLFSLHA